MTDIVASQIKPSLLLVKRAQIPNQQTYVCYSNDSDRSQIERKPNHKPRFPNLMNFPIITWPHLIHSIRNWFLYKFIINAYFDSKFSYEEFTQGAKQALIHVSSLISRGDFGALNGLLTKEALSEIQTNWQYFNDNQRFLLKIKKEDLFFTFIHQIGIIFDAVDSKKRFVEIMVVFHALSDFDKIDQASVNLNDMGKYQDRITICNYRFIREYTKDVEGEWQINLLNHFRADSF